MTLGPVHYHGRHIQSPARIQKMDDKGLVERCKATTEAIQMAAERLGAEAAMDSLTDEGAAMRAKMKAVASDLFKVMLVPHEAATLIETQAARIEAFTEAATENAAFIKTQAALIAALEGALEPFAKIPLCYSRRGSQPQQAKLDVPAPGEAYTAADVVRARKLLP